ncbi:MAG TPA: flippase-like domain-containing protein, partial [Chloroflexota bacterium]|nr:flippase-like domain-containing protein [Chloroflexota bacterium]
MRRLRLILGVAISIGLLFFVFRGIHLQRTLAAARTANYEFFAFSIGFLMLSLVIKAVRWQFLLAPVRRVRFLSLFSAVLIAFFSNNILPSNAGDLVRNVVLGKREGIPQSAVFATIVVEKILDIGTLACFALAFSQIYPVPGWVRLVGFVGTAVFTAAIFILLLLAFRAELVTRLLGRLTARFQSRVVTRAVEQLNTFIYGTRQSFRLSAVLPAIGLSVVLWAVLAVAYLWIGRALSIEAADQAYFLVVSVIGLGSAIPAVLGNVGTLEFFSIDTLQIFGVAQSQGLAFAILLRAARMVPVLLGALVFWRLGFTLFGRGGTTAPAGGPSGDAPPAPDANVVASTRTGPTPLAALRARLVALPAAERASRQAEAVLGRLGLGRPEVLSDMFSNRTDLATSIALTLIVGFAAIIRFYRLGANSLWVDEIATAYYIQPDQSWWWTATNPLYAPIPCPPLIFLMSRVTTLLGPSEFFIRLPAALMGIIGVALTYWVVGHMFGRVAGLIGSFLLAVSRFHLHYSQDARYYPPLLVFSVAALYCFWRALDLNTTEPIWRTGAASPPRSIRDLLRFDAEHRRWWIGFIVFTLLGTYTHLFALFVPAIATMFIAWLAVRELAWIRENRASPWPFVRQVIGPFAASGLSILILYIPMFPFVVTGLLGPRGVGSSQRPPFTWQVVIQFYFTAFNGFVGGNQAASFIFFTLFLLGLAAMIARHRRGVVLLLLYVFVPVTVVAVSRPQHFFSAKYVIFLLPIYLGLIAYGIANIGAVVRSPRFAIALATVLSLSLGAFSVATYNTYYDTEKQDWRSAVVFLNQVAQPGDVVVVAGSKVAFGADKALEYAFTYYGLNVPDITYASESPFQDAYPLRQKYAKAPRVWVLLTPSKTNHQLRTKWLEDYQTFHYTKITVFFHDNALVNEQARKQEIDKYYHVALTTKMNWRTASNLALEYMRDGSDPQGVEKAVAQYQQALQSNPDKVSFYLSLGKLAMKQKQYDLAETYLRQAVKFEGNPDVLHGFLLRLLTLSKKPASPPFSPARPYMALGKLDALRGNNAEAITLFQQAVTIAPDKGRPHISLGQLDLKLNKVDDAITELNRAIQAEPKRSRPHLLLAKYYKKNGRPDDAIYQYQAVAALKGGHPHVHISLGKLYQVKGKFDTAQVEYAAAASLRPGKARPPTLMASLYIRQNRLTEAQYQLTRATQLEPTRWKPHVLLGQVYEKQHQPGLAQAELLTAIKVAPTKPKPTISLGKFYQQENRFADARDTLAKTPNPNLRSKLLLGESMARLNDLAGAMTVFQTASKSEPTKAKPHLDIAHLLVWQNQLAAAEAEVQLAIKVEPTDARAYLAAGRTELTAKKYDTARAYLEQAIKLSGTRAGPHLALGHGLIEQKKGGDSLTELQSAASLAPTKARPHLLLARAEMALQNLSEASAQYDQALRLEPGQARPHIGKGVILGKQSQYQAATLEFQQALSHDPSKARAYVGLGKMSGKSDKWTDAIGWFQEALNPPPSAIAPQHRAKPARPKVKPYFMIAIANTKLSDFDAAMKSASRGLSIKNDASRGHVVLGNIYALQEQKATSEGNPDQRGVAERIKNLLGLATAEYQQAAKLQPTKARPVVMQGLLSQQNGDQSAAETTFKRAISVEDKARTHALLGKLYQRQKKIAPASAEFQRTIDLSSKKPRGYVLLGHLKASQKDYKGALAEANAAIKNAVPKARSHLAAGAAQIQLKRPDLAATEFAQAQTLAPTKARPHVALGIANVKQNNLADATAQFRVALGLTGNRARPSTQLGKLSAKQSQWKEAMDWYQSALNAPASGAPPRRGAVPSAEGKAKPYFLISVADARQNHLSDALDMATIGVTVDPQAARGHVQVGNVYALQKNAGSATKEYQAAAKLAPTKARPVTMLGLLLAQHGDSAAARATYAQAIKIQDKGRVHALIGKLDQKASQFDAAANQ